MSAKFKLKPIVLALLPILFAGSSSLAYGQESDNSDEDKSEKEDSIEVIEVQGFRGSLQKSINEKRYSDSVSDSIFAEDIGKSTDQNIADALSRVTGVTVQESGGEGTRISVRGANPNLNQISLNGVALTSSLNGAGGNNSVSDQSVDLSTFSSDILSSISVVKTAAADHDEGSLGANVILRTVKPLNVKEDKNLLEVQGRYNDFTDDNDHKLSGTISRKFLNNTFGVIVTASDETQSTRTDTLGSHWLSPYEVVDVRAGGATSLQTGMPITEAQKAIIATGKSYATNLNQRDRQTVNLGLQYIQNETTDIQLDLSFSKQTVNRDQHSISITRPDLANDGNYVIGDIAPSGMPVDFNDPQHEWWTIDESNNTVIKMLNRNSAGSLGRTLGGNETENNVATLTFDKLLTDNLQMNLKAGYSRTEFEALPNANLNTAHWNTVPVNVTKNTPVELIEPTGYDCSSGQCQIVVGTQPFIFVPDGDPNGSQNISTSAFNPLDPNAHHLGFVSKIDEQTSDTNKSVFLDFDYYVDWGPITVFEFGAKWSSREKDVYTDYQTLEGSGVTVFDPVSGLPLTSGTVADVRMVDVVTGTGLPVDNFMDGLIANGAYNNDFLQGWGILDPNKAFSEVFNTEDVRLVPDVTGSRKVVQDNTSLYAKFNFELMDGRLTGNIGARYVRTDIESFGTPRVQFYNGDNVFDANQLIYDYQLANSNLAPCPAVTEDDDWFYQNIRLDGPCYDPEISPNGELLVTYDENGVPVSIDQNDPSTRGWWKLFRHTDPTTQRKLGESIYPDNPDEIHRRTYKGRGSGKSDILLPSLNLNYALNEEMIARFAASKTMARPQFDSLRPGFSANEAVWGDGVSRATVYNPGLEPLESKNLDVSFEWYFDDTGLISLAYFRKDMSNFEERVTDFINYLDIRSDYERTELTWEEFAIAPEDGQTPQNSDCMPARMVQARIRNPLDFSCDSMRATVIRNGKGALTQGVEFSYSQDYKFLPGFWSGLGATFNYTFADSENDPEILELTGTELKALPQAYTPKHSANTTLFWEMNGHQLRLSHRYNGIQLVNRGLANGAEWQDSTTRVDFSASYKYSENVTFTFHALNLTDDTTRTFFTSTSMNLGMTDADGNVVLLDEGNPMDGGVDTSRTIREWKTGRQYRISARINF